MKWIQLNWSDEPGQWKDFAELHPDDDPEKRLEKVKQEWAEDKAQLNLPYEADFRIVDVEEK